MRNSIGRRRDIGFEVNIRRLRFKNSSNTDEHLLLSSVLPKLRTMLISSMRGLATETLLAVIETFSPGDQLDRYGTVELIKRLQKSPDADQDALFKIEWTFLPWLDQFSSGSPITLEKQLASNPVFFADLVKLIFRSKNDKEKVIEPD